MNEYDIWLACMLENDPDVVVDMLGISTETLLEVFREEAERYFRQEIQCEEELP